MYVRCSPIHAVLPIGTCSPSPARAPPLARSRPPIPAGRNTKTQEPTPLSFGCGDAKGLLCKVPDFPFGTPNHSWDATLTARVKVACRQSHELSSRSVGSPWGSARAEHSMSGCGKCVESTGRFPLLLTHQRGSQRNAALRGSGGREGQCARVSWREREQLDVSKCSGTTVSGRFIHFTSLP